MFAPLCIPRIQPRVRGGWRQRHDAAARPDPVPPPKSALRHLLNWGDGATPAVELGRHMQDLVDDGEVQHPMVHNLAGILGSQEGSAAHRLFGLLERCGFPALISEMPGPLMTHFVKPSTWLELLHRHFRASFEELLGADPDYLADFWAAMLPRSAELRDHPLFQNTTRAEWRHIVPLTLHEDAGPFTKKKVRTS